MCDFAGEVEPIVNHLTELLDFFGHGTYSPDYQAPQPDARLWSVGHTSRIGGSKKESRAWAAESRASAVTPSRSPSLKRPRKPQPGAFLYFTGSFRRRRVTERSVSHGFGGPNG